STIPLFGIAIWLLAAYMQAGSRAQTEDVRPLAIRVLGPLTWPFKVFFTFLFDLGEWIAGGIARVVGFVLGRAAGRSLPGARTGRRVMTGISLLVLGVLLVFELFPFYFAFVSAFKTEVQIMDMASILWPRPWTGIQFNTLFADTEFVIWYKNTVLITVVAT